MRVLLAAAAARGSKLVARGGTTPGVRRRRPEQEKEVPERSQAGMAPRRRAEIHVTLLGAFALRVGDRQRVLPKGVRRLIALLALNRDGLDRPAAASLLTPHLAPKNAAGSLRTTLSRLRGAGLQMLEKDRSTLRLAPHVTVDCWELEALAVRLLEGALEPLAHDDSSDLAPRSRPACAGDVRPQAGGSRRAGRGVEHAPQSACGGPLA